MPASPLAIRSAAPGIVLLARAGYAAKGLVYIVIGALAARVAVRSGGETTDQHGAIRTIGDGPFGAIALVVIAVGLLGYTAWRLVAAVTDAEGDGSDATSLGKRLASAARGLAYGALGLYALRAVGRRGASDDGAESRTRDWTARLLDLPFGRALVVAIGIGVIAFAAYQVYRATSDKVKKHLDLTEAASKADWIIRLGRFGVAARGVVFALIGAFLVKAGLQRDSREAGGIAQSLDAVAGAPFGQLALGIVALGLVAYGVYQLATARYRRIRAMG